MTCRLVVALATAVVVLLAPPTAETKDGVRATLETAIPLHVTPGERITITWSLADSEGHPFGAGGLFVRLRGPGGETEEAYADGATHPDGSYRASVTVPAGGIDSIEFGLRGITSGPDGTRRGDLMFPLTNALGAPIALAAEEAPSGEAASLGAGVGVALVIAAAALLVRRRSRSDA